MKPRHQPCLTWFLAGLALLGPALLAACGSTNPSRFYTLSCVPDSFALSEVEGGPVVRLGPVELAEYLSRPEIVTRSGANRIELGEFDRWAASLEELFSLTLALNLHALLPSEQVVSFPWEDIRPDHALTVSVGQFDVMDGKARLVARWSLAGRDEGASVKLSTFEEPVAGDGYDAIVAALSATLADLSREIAAAILAAEEQRAGG